MDIFSSDCSKFKDYNIKELVDIWEKEVKDNPLGMVSHQHAAYACALSSLYKYVRSMLIADRLILEKLIEGPTPWKE